jgi:hypothetical protein
MQKLEQMKSGEYLLAFGQNILSSCLLSKNLKVEIYKMLILPVILYGCETC